MGLPETGKAPAWLARGLMVLGGVAMGAMCVMIVADVLSKFLFNLPILGTLEIVSNYFMIATVFLPLAYTQHHRAHVDVEIFSGWLGPRGLRVLDAAVALVCMVALFVFAWKSGETAVSKMESDDSVTLAFHSIPVWPARWFLPFSAFSFALIFLSQFVASVRAVRHAEKTEIKP